MESSKQKDTAVAGPGDGKKPSKKKAKGGEASTFIPHEEVKQTPPPPIQEEAIPVHAEEVETPEDDEKRKKLEIARLGMDELKIAEIRNKYGALAIKGPDDKEGYKVVRAAWSEVRSLRTGLEKKGVAIRSKIAEITKAVKKEEDRLIEMLEPLEEQLQKLWKDIDDAKEKEKKDKEAAEHQRLMARINELIDMGMTLTEGFYRIGDTISMDVATLRALPDAQYEQLKNTVRRKAEELAELKKQKDLEEQKEKDRLKAEQDQLQADQDKVKEEKRQLMADRREVRLGKLEALGFQLSTAGGTENMYFRKLAFNLGKVLEMEGFEFAIFLQTTTDQVKDIKVAEDQEERRKQLAEERTKQLVAIGLEVDGDNFIFDNDFSTPRRWPVSYLTTCAQDLFVGELEAITGDVAADNQAKVDHEEGQRKEKEILEDKKRFISASMERAGMSYGYTSELFSWEDDNKRIAIGWNDLLPLTEPEVSDKVHTLEIQIAEAKQFTKDQKEEKDRKDQEEKTKKMGDKERWAESVKSLKDTGALVMDPKRYNTKDYQDGARRLTTQLNELLNKL